VVSDAAADDDGDVYHGDWRLQGGLSNEAFEDNFVPDGSQYTTSDVRDVYRERDELRTQLEFATDELRQYKPEYVHPRNILCVCRLSQSVIQSKTG